ncbi:MAG: dTDP-4-dehydrorhamnose reductase [Bacteroidales bacterium]|nr:dTDP-4-dehydrorhamnose reductase [Bacteroidales bacterium]
MKTILVTGSDGQLGSELKKISSEFIDFTFLFTDVSDLDITDINALENYFANYKVDFIINCAAYTNVDKAETDKENADKINATAVQNLAFFSNKYKVPLIHISTDYVFDGISKIPYKETDNTNPQSAYGKTKLKGEKFAKEAYKHIIIRTSWLYSSFGNNFVRTMLRLGKEKDEINVVSDQIGSPAYAKDLANVILSIINKSDRNIDNFKTGIYHFSNEGSCSWYEFAKEIFKQKKINCKVNPIGSSEYPTPTKRPEYSLLDKSKIKETFKINIRYWKDSLKECLNSLQ